MDKPVEDDSITADSAVNELLQGSGFLPTTQATPGALSAGHQLNEYRIESLLGGGGFGLTYLAHDTLLDCKVAIKEFLPGDIAVRGDNDVVQPRQGPAAELYEQGLRRFLEESRALAYVRHPNIVRVNRFFEGNGTAYMVMEYERGLPLSNWIKHRRPLDRNLMLAIVRPLLDGLEAIHERGFLHRDVKPSNIYIRDDGQPVLLDFGAARRFNGSDNTMTAIVTPGFAPFEQYHSHGHQGPWSDIYSMGAVMYWLVTGQRPVEAAARVHSDPLVPAARLADHGTFGASLLRAIDWALEPDGAKRPRSVADFRRVFIGGTPARPPLAGDSPVPVQVDERQNGSTDERRTVVASVLYAAIDGSADLPTSQRLACKSRLDEALTRACREIDGDSRLLFDTEHGSALCLLGEPEDACAVAQQLRRLRLEDEGSPGLQQGINLGPVRTTVSAGKGTIDVAGDGLDTARALAALAAPGQILVSRAYFETVSALGSGTPDGLRSTGQRVEIASRHQEVFELDAHSGISLRNEPLRTPASTPGGTDAGLLDTLEGLLARHIGPLARVLVARHAQHTPQAAALVEALGQHIPLSTRRDTFLIEARRLLSQSTNARSSATPAGPELPSRVRPSAIPPSGSARLMSAAVPVLDDSLLAAVEKQLALYLGPMARIVVGRCARSAPTPGQLYDALAQHIAEPNARAAFLKHRPPQ